MSRCKFSLYHGTVAAALIDSAGAVLGVFLSVLSLIFLLFFETDLRIFLEDEEISAVLGKEVPVFIEENTAFVSAIAFTLTSLSLGFLALATFLYKGAKERNARSCQLWWKIKVAFFILGVILASGLILISENPSQLALFSVFGFIYQAVALWVVQAYIDEIKFGKKLSRHSTNETADCSAGLYA